MSLLQEVKQLRLENKRLKKSRETLLSLIERYRHQAEISASIVNEHKVFKLCEIEVAKAYALNPEEIYERTRKRHIVMARQTMSWLLTRKTNLSLADIGRRISSGGLSFDHATVLYSRDKVEDAIDMYKRHNFDSHSFARTAIALDDRIPTHEELLILQE